jgi:hypothetical protein
LQTAIVRLIWFVTTLSAITASVCHAQTDDLNSWPASKLYAHGVSLVKKGIQLNEAILALELSVERPDLAAAVVRSAAFARSPLAALASEIFGVFDSTMDRVSARFTAQSRKLVALVGIAVALALPLDTFDLLKRLERSDSAREQAVALAQTFAANQSSMDPTAREVRVAAAKLQAAEVIVVPSSRAEWLARWQQVNWAGVAVSALLLTLGGPFWFTVLKDLLRLRSAAAGQESQDRAQRQAALTDSPPPANGERGTL